MSVPSAQQPPVAERREQIRTHHGRTFIEPYEWLREKDSPEVVAHLEAENAYAAARLADQEELREQIFTEIRARTRETDMSVPARQGAWWYFSRTVEGSDYSIACRVPIADEDDWTPPSIEPGTPLPGEEIVLDGNVEAEGRDFFQLGSFDVSPDGDLLAWAADVTGDERYELRIRDLRTGTELPEVIPETAAGATWAPGGCHLFYSTVDEAWRPDRIWRHEVGTDPSEDVVVFHEPDERYWSGIGVTRSERFLMISTGSKITASALLLDADDPTGEFTPIWPREEGVEYGVEHAVVAGEDRLLILHNRDRADFDLVDVPLDAPTDAARHRPVLASVEGLRLEGLDAFAGHLVLSYRRDGGTGLAQIALGDDPSAPYGPMTDIDPGVELAAIGLAANPEFHQPRIRFVAVSLADPSAVIEAELATGERHLLKRQEVLGDVDLSALTQARLWARAADGSQVPITLVWSSDAVPTRGGRPVDPAAMVLYGYGAYEASMDPWFSVPRLSLLQRGVVFAIAHVRGGGEMGRAWYEQGRMEHKKNSFTDFIACAEHLIAEGWTSPDRLAAMGGSAGGLLMGAVANMAPQHFAGIAAAVPFVDPLTSILDPSLPLTVIEWDEWGDPLHDAEVYDYMASYSPYENVCEQEYPQVLATTSLHDTRVLYVEPAKWTARLREVGADVILKTELTAGHGGVSGRYGSWRETALEFAWMLRVIGAG